MQRLIITNDASGAGHLKMTGIADQVPCSDHLLTWGPIPTEPDPARFFEQRLAMLDAHPAAIEMPEAWARKEWTEQRSPAWRDLVQTAQSFDEVQLWVDPTPNAQLLLVQWLHRFAAHPALCSRLVLMQACSRLGEREAKVTGSIEERLAQVRAADRPLHDPREHLREGEQLVAVDTAMLQLAQTTWAACTEPAPLALRALLDHDIGSLPALRAALRRAPALISRQRWR